MLHHIPNNTLRDVRLYVLIWIVAMLVVLVFPSEGWAGALSADSPMLTRLTYQSIHASFLHYALNSWCLLQLFFGYRLSGSDLIKGFLVSAAVPSFCLSTIPTVGASGVIFALLGIHSLRVKQQIRMIAFCAISIAMGYLVSGVNAALHLFCFLSGLVLSAITYPILCKKR